MLPPATQNWRWNANIRLLPFREQQPVYDTAMNWGGGIQDLSIGWDQGCPAPWDGGPWDVNMPGMRCPSDGAPPRHATTHNNTYTTNYVFSHGDWVAYGEDFAENRGAFIAIEGIYKEEYEGNSFASITDGTSNTVAMSERCIGSNRAREILGGIVVNQNATCNEPWDCNPAECLATVGTHGQYDPSYWGDCRD